MHNGVKKYTCEYCQKKFNKRNTLNNHKRLHTGTMTSFFFLSSSILFQVRSLSSAHHLGVEWPLCRELLVKHMQRRDTTLISSRLYPFFLTSFNTSFILRIYPRNPECPQSEATLAQLSLEQRLEQQKIQQRLRQQQHQQLQHQQNIYPQQQQQQQQQHTVPVTTSVMDPAQQIQSVTLSSNQSIQVGCAFYIREWLEWT